MHRCLVSCVKINNNLNWNQLEYYIHVMFNPHCPSLSAVAAFIWFPHSVITMELISTMAMAIVDDVRSKYLGRYLGMSLRFVDGAWLEDTSWRRSQARELKK